ncbi:MAG: glycosyltransferase family 2 protein [Candidatus Rifleibacteriota bacterium]
MASCGRFANSKKIMPIASIIILNWNGLQHLHDLLTSLKNQSFKDYECIVVDNGSKDGSREFIQQNFPWVKLISLQKNTGFATGNNIGFKHSTGKYIITLNNDTLLDWSWLEQLVKTAEKDSKIGMVASRICSYYDHDKIDSLGMKICIDGMSRGAFRNRDFSSIKNIPDEILLPSACAALYKRAMLEQIGFFDDCFFAYCEDTDLGLRARKSGWKAALAANAIVYHKYSSTSGAFSPFKLYLVERNHFWQACKNLPLIFLLTLPITSLMRYCMQLLFYLKLFKNENPCIKNNSSTFINMLLKGVWHGICGALPRLKDRLETYLSENMKQKNISRLLKKYHLSFYDLLKD